MSMRISSMSTTCILVCFDQLSINYIRIQSSLKVSWVLAQGYVLSQFDSKLKNDWRSRSI